VPNKNHMNSYRAPTLTRLHDGLCRQLVHARKEKLDIVSTVDVQMHNILGMADSMEWDFDLKDLWLTKSRWSMLVRQYIDPDRLMEWLTKSATLIGREGRGVATMRTNEVKPRGGKATGHSNKESRRWGSCMLSISYKAMPRRQITLHSRTSYMGYLSALDLTVAWMCGVYLAKMMGVPINTISFCWFNEAMQYHNFKSLAYLLNHPDPVRGPQYRQLLLDGKPVPEFTDDGWTPAIVLSRNWLHRIQKADQAGDTYGDMNYNTYRRIRRRYHTEVLGYEMAKTYEGWSHDKVTGEEKQFFKAYPPLPSCKAVDLDFSAIGVRLDGLKLVRYDGDASPTDDEEDDDG